MTKLSPSQIAFQPQGALFGDIQPPGSKSITNRALICAALSDGQCVLQNMLWSEDTEVMLNAWKQLGLHLEIEHDSHICRIRGTGGKLPIQTGDLYVANSGTTIRFLTAALAACHGSFVLDGVARMRERPIGDLVRALNQMQSNVSSLNESHPECPPLKLVASGLRGGDIEVGGNVSSQFLSGLMMASPLANSDVKISIAGGLVSRPYVEMTAAVMASFGVQCQVLDDSVLVPAPQSYRACNYSVEPDASAASYFLAAAAITGGQATVRGLGKSSLQGDVHFADVLEQMGCEVHWSADSITVRGGNLHGVEVDMSKISDTVQTLAAVAVFAQGTTIIRGVEHNRFKETDRISDLVCELRRIGMEVDEFRDGLAIHPREVKPAVVQTYNDHRMAMSLSLIGLRISDLWIDNPSCTAKTYPHYFEDMSACFGLKTVRR